MLNATCDLSLSEQPEIEVDARATPKPKWCEQKAARSLMVSSGMEYQVTYRHPGANHCTDNYRCAVACLVGVVVRYDDGAAYFKLHHRGVELFGFATESRCPLLLQHAKAFIATATAIEGARAETGGVHAG